VAGFEWGTGFYINPTPPEESADSCGKLRSKNPLKSEFSESVSEPGRMLFGQAIA